MNNYVTHIVIDRLYTATEKFLGLFGFRGDSKLTKVIQTPIDMALNYALRERSKPKLTARQIRSMSCDELLALGYSEEELMHMKPDEPDFTDIAAMQSFRKPILHLGDATRFEWPEYSLRGKNHGKL